MSKTDEVNPNNAEQKDVEDSVFGSSQGFFDDLDREVNGAVMDGGEKPIEENKESVETTKETPLFTDMEKADPKADNTDWQKRYSDSSREAQRLKDELDKTNRFKPYIEALEKDQGLVNHIKEYVENGQEPKPIKEALKLPEDFVFDMDEALGDANSNSAKVLKGIVNQQVSSQVDQRLKQENDLRQQDKMQSERDRQAKIEFKQKMGLDSNNFNELMDWANNHKISFEDIYYLKNKDSAMQNVAQNTKSDMLNQMKAVRNIPTSASATNSQARTTDVNDAVFEAIKNIDGGIDSLFND